MTRKFRQLLGAKWAVGKFVCVGLDTDASRLDDRLRLKPSGADGGGVQAAFNRAIVEATSDLVCAYKANTAFYEANGAAGLTDLRITVEHIQDIAPDVPIIIDAKLGDIGSSNQGYEEFVFDYLCGDAVTVHPYLGQDSLEPFLARADKGILVLCRTSNPGAAEFQDLRVSSSDRGPEMRPLFEVIAEHVATEWNANKNCGLVAGATFPEELSRVRALAGDMPLLIPGIGAQGGDLADSVRRGAAPRGGGIVINASRSVIFRSVDERFAEAAASEVDRMNDQISRALSGADVR